MGYAAVAKKSEATDVESVARLIPIMSLIHSRQPLVTKD